MLTKHDRKLLTAYVDGELGARQRKAVLRLLERSAEARLLLRHMQHDAAGLRQLPFHKLDRDLSAPVLQAIAERKLQPGSRRWVVERHGTNVPVWAAFSALAASLLLVALGSYLYFNTSMNLAPDDHALAERKDPQRTKQTDTRKDSNDVAVKPPVKPLDDPELVSPPAVAQGPRDGPDAMPENDMPPEAAVVLGAPDLVAGMEMFKAAHITKPEVVKPGDLDHESARLQALKILRAESGYRMDSPCQDGVKAFDRLQAALKANGISLAIDQVAQARINARRAGAKVKTNFVLYVEDVTPEELVKVLQQAGIDDRKAEAKKKGDRQFEGIVVYCMIDADREELCKLLGVKAKKLPDPPAGPLGVDIRKPLSDATGDDIAKTISGQGGVPRPEPGKPATKPTERLALAMPYNPVRPRPESAEIKRFLANRKAPRPGTVQVLLVVRETGA